MSIFQIKEWWATTVGNSEEFDTNSIHVAVLDKTKEKKIITGTRFLPLIFV
jgi:hypothetical protein